MSDFAPNRGHPNDSEAVRAHLRNSALTLTEEERMELLDELNRQIDEIDNRKSNRPLTGDDERRGRRAT